MPKKIVLKEAGLRTAVMCWPSSVGPPVGWKGPKAHLAEIRDLPNLLSIGLIWINRPAYQNPGRLGPRLIDSTDIQRIELFLRFAHLGSSFEHENDLTICKTTSDCLVAVAPSNQFLSTGAGRCFLLSKGANQKSRVKSTKPSLKVFFRVKL